MMGMEMLLQSFGVDTEEVKANIQSAVELVRLMNEQLAQLRETTDRIEAKQDAQTQLLALLVDRTSRDEWPPQLELPRLDDAGRTEGTAATASANAASGDAGRG